MAASFRPLRAASTRLERGRCSRETRSFNDRQSLESDSKQQLKHFLRNDARRPRCTEHGSWPTSPKQIELQLWLTAPGYRRRLALNPAAVSNDEQANVQAYDTDEFELFPAAAARCEDSSIVNDCTSRPATLAAASERTEPALRKPAEESAAAVVLPRRGTQHDTN